MKKNIDEFLTNANKRKKQKNEVTEADIEAAFCKYANNKGGCNALKLAFITGRGFPDRTVICKPGRIFFIEFKRQGGELTKLQSMVRRWLESYGFDYFVCDKKGMAESHLDDFLKIK